ncbi:MAG: hypothetical protein ACI9X4_000845 [Glaciecola sp.]|jgi:hypothetical protein
MNRPNKTLIAFLSLLLGLSACGPVDFKGQDLALRHDVENNVLELNLTYHGVMASKSPEGSWGQGRTKELELAVQTIRRMAAGDRYFMLLSSIFEIDLEKSVAELSATLISPEPGQAQHYLDIVERFSIEPAQIYLDDKERIAVRQKIQIKGALESTLELNNAIQEGLLLWVSEGAKLQEETDGLIDTPTANAWIAEAKSGEPWIFWKDQTLVISVPMSPKTTANLIKAQVRAVAEETESKAKKNIANLIGTLSEVQVQDGRLILRIAPDELGFLNLRFVEDDRKYLPGLADSLKAKGFPLSTTPSAGQ